MRLRRYHDFGAVLLMTHWISVPSEPALWAYREVEDEATIMRRAASIKQHCLHELNVCERDSRRNALGERLASDQRHVARGTRRAEAKGTNGSQVRDCDHVRR